MADTLRKKVPSEKLEKELNFLINQKTIFDVSKEKYEANIWSVKKLILLSHYLYPYLSILTTKENGSYKYSDSWFYIDLFSGPGASIVNEYGFEMLGSPIISLLKGIHYIKKRREHIRFTKWFFIEKNGTKCEALKKRVNIALEEIKLKYNFPIPNSNVIIHQGDCNKKIDSILEEIENYKRPSILLFADPEGIVEIEWTTISKILSKKIVDIIYILSTGGFKRAVKKEHLEKNFPPLSEEERSKILSRKYSSEALVEIFVKSILKEVKRYRIFYESLPIHNEKNTEVYRIVWTSCSRGAANAMKSTFELIKKISNEDILQAIQVIRGKQEKLRIT